MVDKLILPLFQGSPNVGYRAAIFTVVKTALETLLSFGIYFRRAKPTLNRHSKAQVSSAKVALVSR